jgi:carbon storage regulator
MLVLTRRANQSIVIGQDVTVTILEIRGDQVRLGIRAPKEVSVHREEVFAEIRRENQRAAAAQSDDASFLPPAPRR